MFIWPLLAFEFDILALDNGKIRKQTWWSHMDMYFPIIAHSFQISTCLLTEAFITCELVEVVTHLCNPSKLLVRQKGKYTNPDFIRQEQPLWDISVPFVLLEWNKRQWNNKASAERLHILKIKEIKCVAFAQSAYIAQRPDVSFLSFSWPQSSSSTTEISVWKPK